MGSTFTDQLGQTIRLTDPPARIISLVPSQTELLYDLGLDQEVVGITRFCVHPKSWFQSKTKVGGTKDFQLEKIDALSPVLIIGNKEENDRERITALKEKYPVWMSDVVTLEDALNMIQSVGAIVQKEVQARTIIQQIRDGFKRLRLKSSARLLYLIWKDPWMGAGKNTFINSMLEHLGLANVLQEARYPVLTDQAIRDLSPEVILLSSEPFPFREKHLNELRQLLPHAKILLVDGKLFSWYGSRLIKAPEYFNSLNI